MFYFIEWLTIFFLGILCKFIWDVAVLAMERHLNNWKPQQHRRTSQSNEYYENQEEGNCYQSGSQSNPWECENSQQETLKWRTFQENYEPQQLRGQRYEATENNWGNFQENNTTQYYSLNEQRNKANKNYNPGRRQGGRRGRGYFRNYRYRGKNNKSKKECDVENSSNAASLSSSGSQVFMAEISKGSCQSHDKNLSEENLLQSKITKALDYSPQKDEINSTDKVVEKVNVKNKLQVFREHRRNFEKSLKDMDLTDIIMDYRQEIDEMTKESINKNLKNQKEISSKVKSSENSILKSHLKNLILQQNEFENYVAHIKTQLSSALTSNISELLNHADKIKNAVSCECSLFQRALPLYAYKNEIIDKIKENDVTIIMGDSAYTINILLPIFVKNMYPKLNVTLCESSKSLMLYLKESLFHLVKNGVGICKMDERRYWQEFNFTTEDTLLSILSSDYTYDEKNVITILNLPLKRSLTLDIVLADLRDLLRNQKNSKLILIASINDNVSKYETFFSEYKVCKITLPSLSLPVRTIWKRESLSSVNNLVTDAVKTILSIISLQSNDNINNDDNGDILIFVPTLADAKSILGTLNQKLYELQCKNIECVLLSENSEYKPCLNCFSRKSTKKRLFVATDCIEMIVIASVSHVVDIGLKKENVFNSKKKLDVLTTSFISQAKAKLRRSLAGVFCDGICYRLYSKEDYSKTMFANEFPELLTVNPFNSMIKIFQHRPDVAADMDFVQSLPKSQKKNSLYLLNKYNAVKDNKLTKLGKMIVRLPFPVKYSKLILLANSRKLLYEAVVLIAFFSVKGRVFQFHQDAELQRATEAAKLRLMDEQEDSDTLTYLFVYRLWLENKMCDNWCKDNYINASTLKNVHAKVREICEIVHESIKEVVYQEFSRDYRTGLLEILFECFSDSLCVFTGHYRSGYRLLSSHCIAFLHPSSVVCQLQKMPKFIIFGHMTTTTRDFLECITSIPKDLIMQALTDKTIDFDYSDMFEKSLVKEVIEPVGERNIKQALLGKEGKKLKVIEDHIKKLLETDSLVIEPLPEKGVVNVFAYESIIHSAVKLVNEIVKRRFEDIVNSEKTNVLELKKGEIKIPVEIKWLKGARVTSVRTGVGEQATVIQNNLCNSGSSEQSQSLIQKSINLTWIRRPCNGQAVISFEPRDFGQARRLAMRYVGFSQSDIFIQLSKHQDNQLFITELPHDCKADDLKRAFIALLRDVPPERLKVELRYVPSFETSENELREVQKKIEDLCQQLTVLKNFTVIVPKIKSTATMMKAYVNVSEEEDINVASRNLSSVSIEKQVMQSRPVYRAVVKCSIAVCEALKSRFGEELTELHSTLQKKFKSEDLFEFEINKVSDDVAAIKMLSNCNQILSILQVFVNKLLGGEILDKSFSSKLNKIFCHGGRKWLKTLERMENIHIIEDYFNKTLRLYGSVKDVKLSKDRIAHFLEDTENEAVKDINLSSFGNNRKLLKDIIKQYGANLEQFIEIYGLQYAVLDIRGRLISMHGSRECIEEAENSLRKLAKGLSETSTALSNEELCPVCACPAFNLTLRLEICGHLYCSECIEGLVEQAQFPIKCAEENCSQDIVLDDIYKAVGDDVEKVTVLVEKSMKQYLEQHKNEIFSCPAPDCSMFFYKKEITGQKINCSLCQNDICIKCNAVYHQGYTCAMYQGSKDDPDFSFKTWQKDQKNCKQCPNCQTAIERTFGCDHMVCGTCKAHFCFQCVTEFPTQQQVYDHIYSLTCPGYQ